MSKRPFKIIATVFCLCAFAGAAFNFSAYSTQRARVARERAFMEGFASMLFQRVQPMRGRAWMTPARSDEFSQSPDELFLLPIRPGGDWKEPKLVERGFRFCYFNGAKAYRFEVIALQPDGVLLQCDEDGGSVLHQPFTLRWKA